MKLLICTQVVDKNHPILGFFHRWIEEFAKNCEEVHVICLQKGEYTLPSNVYVYSLGKESGNSKFAQLFNFYSYIWKLRKRYDNVFVHMNQIYVILGAPLWRLFGKRVGLWYAHGAVSNSLKVAEKLAHIMFTSTEQGLQLATPKRVIVGQGIDLTLFSYKKRLDRGGTARLITVGRISISKNIETLIEACAALRDSKILFSFSIIGVSSTQAEKAYEEAMRRKVEDLELSEYITWEGAVPQAELPARLQEADIFIHDGATQSLDKALLEAVACGCIVISSNPSYTAFSSMYAPQYLFQGKDVSALTGIIQTVVLLPLEEREDSMEPVRTALREQYSIEGLIPRITKVF